jgi:hypothetical protein
MAKVRHGVQFAALMGTPQIDAWEDLTFPANAINLSGAGGEPTRDATTGYLEFPATGTTTIVVHPQMRHAWKEGSAIAPHVHWRKKTAGAGNVVWQLEYEWTNIWDVATDSLTALTASTVPNSRDDGTAKRHLLTPFSSIDMTGKTISCMGLLRISRLGSDGADTYAGVVQLKEFDIHYMVDSLGSEYEYDKE